MYNLGEEKVPETFPLLASSPSTYWSIPNSMISQLRLKFGRAANLPADTIAITAVTVFVGPNNSGKSKVLSEIQHYCSTGRKDTTAVILDELKLEGFSIDQIPNV